MRQIGGMQWLPGTCLTAAAVAVGAAAATVKVTAEVAVLSVGLASCHMVMYFRHLYAGCGMCSWFLQLLSIQPEVSRCFNIARNSCTPGCSSCCCTCCVLACSVGPKPLDPSRSRQPVQSDAGRLTGQQFSTEGQDSICIKVRSTAAWYLALFFFFTWLS